MIPLLLNFMTLSMLASDLIYLKIADAWLERYIAFFALFIYAYDKFLLEVSKIVGCLIISRVVDGLALLDISPLDKVLDQA